MKRSDMVIKGIQDELLGDILEDCFEDQETSQPLKTLSEYFLNKFQEAGMLPPTVELLSSGDYMPTKELLDYSEIDYDCAWEPEE